MIPLALLLRPKPPAILTESQATRGSENGRVLGLPANGVQLALWLAVLGCCAAMAMPNVHLFSHATDLGFSSARAAELLSVLFAGRFSRASPSACWRTASAAQYLFAALGMALGGWMGGAIHDLTGGYSAAFPAGFAFNIMNLVIIAALYTRQIRLGLSDVPA